MPLITSGCWEQPLAPFSFFLFYTFMFCKLDEYFCSSVVMMWRGQSYMLINLLHGAMACAWGWGGAIKAKQLLNLSLSSFLISSQIKSISLINGMVTHPNNRFKGISISHHLLSADWMWAIHLWTDVWLIFNIKVHQTQKGTWWHNEGTAKAEQSSRLQCLWDVFGMHHRKNSCGWENKYNKYCSKQYLSLLEITKCHSSLSQTVSLLKKASNEKNTSTASINLKVRSLCFIRITVLQPGWLHKGHL